jgi:hypothetical protein
VRRGAGCRDSAGQCGTRGPRHSCRCIRSCRTKHCSTEGAPPEMRGCRRPPVSPAEEQTHRFSEATGSTRGRARAMQVHMHHPPFRLLVIFRSYAHNRLRYVIFQDMGPADGSGVRTLAVSCPSIVRVYEDTPAPSFPLGVCASRP